MIERLKRGGAGRAISGAAAQLAAIFNGILDTSFLSLSLHGLAFSQMATGRRKGRGRGRGRS